MEDKGIMITKRHEYISEVIALTKDKLIEGMRGIYDAAQKVNRSRRFLLRDFQNLLKDVSVWTGDKKKEEFEAFMGIHSFNKLVYNIHVLNVKLFVKDTSLSSKLDKIPLPNDYDLCEFVYDCYLQFARELWKKPYLFYEKVDKYTVQKNVETLEKLSANCLKLTLRRLVSIDDSALESWSDDDEGGDEVNHVLEANTLQEDEDDAKSEACSDHPIACLANDSVNTNTMMITSSTLEENRILKEMIQEPSDDDGDRAHKSPSIRSHKSSDHSSDESDESERPTDSKHSSKRSSMNGREELKTIVIDDAKDKASKKALSSDGESLASYSTDDDTDDTVSSSDVDSDSSEEKPITRGKSKKRFHGTAYDKYKQYYTTNHVNYLINKKKLKKSSSFF